MLVGVATQTRHVGATCPADNSVASLLVYEKVPLYTRTEKCKFGPQKLKRLQNIHTWAEKMLKSLLHSKSKKQNVEIF